MGQKATLNQNNSTNETKEILTQGDPQTKLVPYQGPAATFAPV